MSCSLLEQATLATYWLDLIGESSPQINQVAQSLDTSIPPFVPMLFWLLAVFSYYWATISATSFFVLEKVLSSSKVLDTGIARDLASWRYLRFVWWLFAGYPASRQNSTQPMPPIAPVFCFPCLLAWRFLTPRGMLGLSFSCGPRVCWPFTFGSVFCRPRSLLAFHKFFLRRGEGIAFHFF